VASTPAANGAALARLQDRERIVSTILKALRRLEHEKAAPVGQRPLREEVTQSAAEVRRSRGAWASAVAALVAGAGLGAFLLFLWSSGMEESSDDGVVSAAPPTREAAPAAAEPRVPRAPAPVARRAAAAPAAEVEPEGLSADALASPVEVVERPAPKPLVVEEPTPPRAQVLAAAEPEASAPQTAPRVTEPITPPPPAPAASAASSEAPEPAVAEAAPAAEASAETAVNETSAPQSDAPAARAEPPAAASNWSAAEIRVERTLWHPQASRRVAVLVLPGRDAPLHVHEGDAVGALVVAEIEPSGVVFTREGERTRRTLGD
jgi:hypothetical protein